MIKAILPVVAAAVLLLAACGGDEDTESFIADADALCAERDTAVTQAYADAREASGRFAPPDAALEGQAAAEDQLASELGAIEPPSELEGSYEEMVTLQRQRAELLAAADDSLRDGNTEAMEADRALASLYHDEAYAVARGLGFTECAGRLSAEDEEAVTAAVEDALAEEGATSVEIDEIEGHGEFAEAEVLPTGGRYDEEAVRVLMITEGGEWVSTQIEPVVGESGN
jgi:hypothetical protein